MDRRKLIIGVVAIILIMLLSFLLYFILKKKDDTYTGEPIVQEAISASSENRKIEVDSLKIDNTEKYKIWSLSNQLSLSQIEEMIKKVGLNLPLEQSEEGSFYEWTDNQGNYFQYYLLRNALIFNLVDGIPSYEVNLTSNSFSSFVREYFDTDWDYEVLDIVKFPDGQKFFYAKRLTKDGWGIEKTPNLYGETDYLSLKNGKIVAGEILLTHFFDSQIEALLLNSKDLSRYINDPSFPKTVNVRLDQIAKVLSIEDEYPYMNTEIIALQQEVGDCKAISYSVVYLYTSFEQTHLTPVYRLALECSLEYQGEKYSVPSIGYVNAVDPQYIAVLE